MKKVGQTAPPTWIGANNMRQKKTGVGDKQAQKAPAVRNTSRGECNRNLTVENNCFKVEWTHSHHWCDRNVSAICRAENNCHEWLKKYIETKITVVNRDSYMTALSNI